MKYTFFIFLFLFSNLIYTQSCSYDHEDRYLDSLCVWAITDTSTMAKVFVREHAVPYIWQSTWIQEKYLVYMFAGRCGESMVVLDIDTAKVLDICAYSCDWLEKKE